MEQENTKTLNTINSTPIRNGNLSSKDVNLETPNKSSSRSIGSAGGSSSVRRSSRLLKKNDEKSGGTGPLTPQLGAPGGTPYLLRSKSRETLSSTEANLRKNAMTMPPLNLKSTNDLEGSSEFYQTNVETNNENSNKVGDVYNIYSTPRKRVRGTENGFNSSNNNNNINTGLDLDRDPGSESQIRSSSRRKGNIKNTPVSKSRRVIDEDSAVKDRKSILKQYDPDGINTSTMNIKTPKSQKKVQFGTKNLIIIDENKQDLNIDKLITESDNDENGNIQDKRFADDLTVDRMSILSELDDAGTGQIYNFPSLEELINTKKTENTSTQKVYNNDIVDSEISNRFATVNNIHNYHHRENNQDNKATNPSDLFIQNENSGKDKSITDQDGIIDCNDQKNLDSEYIKTNRNQVQDENNIEKNIELTDQINISDYSINCRDSIAPNLPGAFLSVVMQNLSSVNFPEEKKPESDEDIKIPKLEFNDDNIEDTINKKNDLDQDVSLKEQKPDQEPTMENQSVFEDNEIYIEAKKQINKEDEIILEENKEDIQNQQEQVQFEFESENVENQIQEQLIREENKEFTTVEIVTEKESINEKNHIEESLCHQNDNFETQQIVLTETLTILKDNNNRLSNILITPKRNNISSIGYINKLSPSSETLLKSLNNTKSILNITPQGYTWEEFQSILNLNYTMENYFGILEFDEIENNHQIKDKYIEEESMDSKLLLVHIQNILKDDGNSEKIQEIVAKYSSEIINSIKHQIWDEIEKNILIKEFNGESHERYSENLSKFSTSEIATLMAIIVNKSRYGNKNDEKIKNELFERISGYFFGEGRNIFLKKAIIDWKEKVIFPLKNSIINKFEEMIKIFMLKNEQIMNNKNRIQNSKVLLSTLESCKISEMHVYETYWNAMRIVHENIVNYKEEIERVKNYLNMMDKKKRNISRLLLKEEELYNSLIMELNDWKVKKDSLRNNLNDLRIKEEFAGFTWDLFTINKFQTIIILNNNCHNRNNLVKVKVSIEWNMNDDIMDNPPIILKIELLLDNIILIDDSSSSINSKYNDLQLQLSLVNNQRLEDKIYNAYIKVIERTLNLRLIELYLDYKKKNKMNNNILIELIRGIFQSCIVLLWRLESIVFEILNIIKVFNLAILDIIDENKLILNIPILVGINGKNDIEINNNKNENQNSNFTYSSCTSNSPIAASPITPNSLTSSTLSPHLLMASRPVITITFNITNSLFMSVGTLVNSIEDISVYNMSDEITKDMICVFKDQINEIEGKVSNNNNNIKKNSAVYVGYNCLLSVIQNTIQEGGHNQLIWKRPLEKFAPRLLNAVQISKLHQNF
ncbi:hypothetical protein [Cryptosporidium parvum Iowa II]|uniref:Spc7 kinetochore protein domain-containing protein n=2 Tax=Cryptosporidium parvum TaxID=5807 RepID=Q5CR96_CRYPI|nr:hypothetical protein [Cryptosporidium parvum Iowa II]EAK87913.1 hypothetical protein cgd4_1600 [Cryptosporidium parvum Iowa II]QOY42283.1 Uncharacterized protein CPATCC_0021120 [Cryptosporidium parvum]WKS77584.1 hypothetical protein CPCDC_4g1600 [Cryptosporidium sp. 43IA8]WRK31741.1 Uncharacterized protein cpbgf_4001600 [Cryptosporidium parvum]|eukprot:QOY42283.1 hypothetical protein CPATCC_001909 [Cryptosporidium parvum]